MSWLSDMLGTTVPKPKLYGFDQVQEDMLSGQTEYMDAMKGLSADYRTQADTQFGYQADLMGRSGQFLDQAYGMATGDSPVLDAMRAQQRQALGDVGAQQTQAMNQQMAARGMGGGGLRNVLGAMNAGAMGEQARQGLLGIQQYGLQAGTQLGQLGTGIAGQAAGMGQLGMAGMAGSQSAYGDVASLQAQANQAATQQKAANIQAENQYAAEKAAANRAMWGGILKGAIGVAMPMASGGMFGKALQTGVNTLYGKD